MPRRRHPEDEIQRPIVDFLRVALPADASFTAFPGGGKRSKVEAAIMKGLGVRAGMPDIQIVWQGRYHGIEVKVPKKYPTEVQRDMHAELCHAGGRVAVCRSLADVEETLAEWGIPLKARGVA